jgi:hypothetical protein
MKNLIQAAVVTLFAASTAHAQQAVQWKVSDGGNGHWYSCERINQTWWEARNAATARGGDLASMQLPGEYAVAVALLQREGVSRAWVGGSQSPSNPGYSEPLGGWAWVTGEAIVAPRWAPGEPNNDNQQDYLEIYSDGLLDDLQAEAPIPSLIEWSTDCNHDGVVDYGQCRDGSLPDYNGNNIPDCCERGEACVVGNYPVQWRTEDGGNGHWYRRVNPNSNLTWTQAETLCELIGAHLATVPAASESAFVHLIVGQSEVYLGGLQPPNSCEPNCEWQWLTGEPWSYTNWNPGEPNNSNAEQNFLRTYPNGSWDDVQDGYAFPFAIAAEWDADCNSDGVVDYGQILAGQLADANTNGIPDICEGPTCRDADLFRNGVINGADLGILLSEWGPANPSTVSDITRDGVVDGADLGLLLSFWGACS